METEELTMETEKPMRDQRQVNKLVDKGGHNV